MRTNLERVLEKIDLLDPQELAANQRGEITHTQKRRLSTWPGFRQVVDIVANPTFIWGGIVLLVIFCFFVSNVGLYNNVPLMLLTGLGLFMLFIAFAGRKLWPPWYRITKFRRDYANRAICQGQGQLVYIKKAYVFQTNDRNLALPMNNPGGLLPGATYHVYYLEESGFLLSAEETYATSPIQVRAAINEILAKADGFSLEDLQANQNGGVAAAQRRKTGPSVALGILLALVVPLVIGLAALASKPLSWLIIEILIGASFLAGCYFLFNGLSDMFTTAPKQIQGVASKCKERVRGSGRSAVTWYRSYTYYYVINDRFFPVTQEAYGALIDGLQYRAYYLPRTKRLISIEALEIPSSNP